MAVQGGLTKNDCSRFLKDVLEGCHQGQLFFAPYNSSTLDLNVINPQDEVVYFLDPLWNEPTKEMKEVINNALKDVWP